MMGPSEKSPLKSEAERLSAFMDLLEPGVQNWLKRSLDCIRLLPERSRSTADPYEFNRLGEAVKAGLAYLPGRPSGARSFSEGIRFRRTPA